MTPIYNTLYANTNDAGKAAALIASIVCWPIRDQVAFGAAWAADPMGWLA